MIISAFQCIFFPPQANLAGETSPIAPEQLGQRELSLRWLNFSTSWNLTDEVIGAFWLAGPHNVANDAFPRRQLLLNLSRRCPQLTHINMVGGSDPFQRGSLVSCSLQEWAEVTEEAVATLVRLRGSNLRTLRLVWGRSIFSRQTAL